MPVRRYLRKSALVLALVAALTSGIVGLGTVPLPAPEPRGAAAGPGARHRIFVISNGFHSAIVLPAGIGVSAVRGGTERLDPLAAFGVDAIDFPVDPNLVRHWQFGWGSETAFTSLRAVRDLTPGIALRALAFDVSVMHVQPLGELSAADGTYPLDVSQAQLDALVASIAPFFAETEPMAGVTQGFGDRFYRGRGRFSPIATCNAWTGRRLRAAGIGVGVFTPLAQSLEMGLRAVQAR